MSVDTALELRAPAFHHQPVSVGTDGPLVAELLHYVGFGPDPQQQLCLDDIFAVDAAGNVAAYEAAVIAPRQNIKTGLFKQCAIGWLYVTEVETIIWSAHEVPTAREAHRELAALIEGNKELRRRHKKTTYANGQEAIELVTGQRVLFRARTKTGGRGLTGDRIVLDEAFALHAVHMGALQPTLSAVPDPQLLYGSSACREDSDHLRVVVKRGRSAAGELDPTVEPRLSFSEWTDVKPLACARGEACTHHYGIEGCSFDDESRWWEANPTLGVRIALANISAERKSMPPSEFGRERLGHHDASEDEAALAVEGWVDVAGPGKIVDARAIAVDMSPRRDWCSVALAGADRDGGHRVETLRVERGDKWAVRFLIKRCERWGLDTVYLVGGGQAQAFEAELIAAGLEVHALTNRELGQGCGSFYSLATAGELGHPDQVQLNTAIGGARLRDNGESAWVWSRRNSNTDISPLMAVTAALFGHLTAGETDWSGIDLNHMGDDDDDD